MLLIQKTLRTLIIGLLMFYFAAATVMLGVRYLVLPHINEWRPQIERRLSEALGARVTMGEIAVSWSGLNPSLSLENLRLRDRATNQELLYVPDAFAVVSWRSLLALDIRFQQLEISGVHVSGSRRSDGRVVLAGTLLDEQSDAKLEFSTDTPAFRWLLNQGQIVIRNATFLWDDQFRGAPELVIEGIDFNISNSIFRHQLRISGSLPPELASTFELIVRTDSLLNPLASHEQDDAEIFIEINDAQPGAWQPWLDVPNIQGRFATRIWMTMSAGHFGRADVDLAGANAVFSLGEGDPTIIDAEKLQLRLSGWLGDLMPENKWLIFDRSPDRVATSLSLSSKGLKLDTSLFEPRHLLIGNVTADTQLSRNENQKLQLKATRLNIESDSFQADFHGMWTEGQDASPGVVDIVGKVEKADATKLYQYVTTQTVADAREWMRQAILDGTLSQVDVTVQGDLSNFPFNAKGKEAGIFRLEGQLNDLVVDYEIVSPNQPKWPALTLTTGRFELNKLGLSVKSDQAHVMGMHGRPLQISSFELSASDLELTPNISMRLNSFGMAQDYLAVLKRSPIEQSLGIDTDTFEIKGLSSMPLAVDFDHHQHRVTMVNGQLKLNDVSIALTKEGVPVEKINGVIDFTAEKLTVKELRGLALGGPVTLSGEWGSSKRNLVIKGELTATATEKHQNLSALFAVTGRTSYQADIKVTDKGDVDFEVRSNLEGLTIKLPPPLGKSAPQRRALSVRMQNTRDAKANRSTLTITFANLLNGRFEHTSSVQGTSYFSRGAVVMGGPAVLPGSGFTVNLGFERVNWDDWKTLTDQLAEPNNQNKQNKQNTATSAVSLFPAVTQLRVRSPEFIFGELTLNQLDLMLSKSAAQRWSARLDSRETQGTAAWTTGPRGLVGPVVAKFSKLSIGTEGSGAGEPPKTQVIDDNQWSSMPAMNLTIDDFTLYGSRLGSLQLVAENTDNGSRWKINELEITNPHAKMTAKGSWLLKGAERGVSLDGQIDIKNLGKLSDQLGYDKRAGEGTGVITAKINWTNFPWVYTYSGLNGQVNIDLKDGVFQHVNSRSARLLEVLSLQSLQRILSFNFRTGDEFKDGFPWNSIRGDLSLTQGVVHTKDLVVRSPIARIALTGGSDLNQKTWELDADVRPILDMSGAAVATAFVVNPIAGLSALVTQFVLRNPIEQAMSAKYKVKGPWDEPELIPIGVPTPVETPTHSGG